MKEKAEFRLNAIALAFTAYEGRIKRIYKKQQDQFVKNSFCEPLLLYGPDENEVNEATEMLWQAYLCGMEAKQPGSTTAFSGETYALAVPEGRTATNPQRSSAVKAMGAKRKK